VTVGLPVPWLLYTIIFQTHMPVSSVGMVIMLLYSNATIVNSN
jgi:hypothetical protein